MNKSLFILGYLIISVALIGNVSGQEKEKYILGKEQKLEMIVHVFGEVQRPGEYRVRDNTNVIELISKAGGPTEFSRLSGVRITRMAEDLYTVNEKFSNNSTNSKHKEYKTGKRIIKINLAKYLKNENAISPPKLQPGDIVYVPRNNWFRWRNTVAIARDLAAIASLYFFVIRK